MSIFHSVALLMLLLLLLLLKLFLNRIRRCSAEWIRRCSAEWILYFLQYPENKIEWEEFRCTAAMAMITCGYRFPEVAARVANLGGFEALVTLMHASYKEKTRQHAALALGYVYLSSKNIDANAVGDNVVSLLVALLSESLSEDTRSRAAWTICIVCQKSPHAADRIVDLGAVASIPSLLLPKSHSEYTRNTAAWMLAYILCYTSPIVATRVMDSDAVAALLAILESSRPEVSRASAAKALGFMCLNCPGFDRRIRANDKAITSIMSLLLTASCSDQTRGIAKNVIGCVFLKSRAPVVLVYPDNMMICSGPEDADDADT